MGRRLGKAESTTLFNSLIEGAVIIGADTRRIVLANKAAAIMFGYLSPEAMIGADPLDHIPQEDRERVAGIMARYSVEDDLHRKVDTRTVALDGREVWVTAMGVRTEHEGQVAGLILMKDITAQKVAEKALAEAEEAQRRILEEAKEPILVIQDGKVVFANPRTLELGGITEGEISGKPFADFLLPEDRERVMQRYLKRVGDKDCRSLFVVRGIGKDGSVRWSEIQETSVMWKGKPSEICYVHDITDRKKAEEALEVSESRYRLLTEHVSDVIWVTDLELKPTYFNPAVARLLGYTVGEALAGAVKMAPSSLEAAMKSLREGLEKEGKQPGSASGTPTLELGFIHSDGSTVWAETTVSFLRDSAGHPFAILGILHDVSERKKAEEALRRSEERFRALVETTSDWVWEVDRKGVYTYASPKVSRVLGYDSKEIVGKTPFDFMPEREARRVAVTFNSFVDKQEPFAFLENVYRHKEGHPVVMETSGVPFFAPDGTLLGYRGVDRDITERKQVGKRLQQSLKKIERTMEAVIQAISITVETRDPYTAGHQRRVTQLASVMAIEMGLSSRQVAGIRVAGLLHDIGKISIPTEILSKPGQLSNVEMKMIRSHPMVGYGILKNIEFEWPVAHIILQHHERMDGSGYPEGVRGEDILVEARILAVADVVEAMSSHRPYRPAMGGEKALQEITRGEGRLYDPIVVQACLGAFTKKGFQFQD